jgi:hypothetical protein
MRCESGQCHSGTTESSYRLPQGPGLPSLLKDLRNQNATVRFYYINSVRWINDANYKAGLYQTGCGLNLQSKYATLCTCKLKMLEQLHKDRRRLQEYPVYVAALGVKKGRQPDSTITPLVFLGKVKKSFDSFSDIWEYLPKQIRYAKDVSRHFLGDLYNPRLVRKYRQTGRIQFSKEHAHASGSYKKDLEEARPVVFNHWKSWPGADVGFKAGSGNIIGSKLARRKFEKMIKAPRQSAYGWKYYLSDLQAIIRQTIL